MEPNPLTKLYKQKLFTIIVILIIFCSLFFQVLACAYWHMYLHYFKYILFSSDHLGSLYPFCYFFPVRALKFVYCFIHLFNLVCCICSVSLHSPSTDFKSFKDMLQDNWVLCIQSENSHDFFDAFGYSLSKIYQSL